IFARRSSGRVFHHASVSFAIVAIGRHVNPALTARALLHVWKPFISPAYGAQIGNSTPSSFITASAGIHLSEMSFALEHALHASSVSPHVSFFSGPHALNVPIVCVSASLSMNAERSRTSITCNGSLAEPGTRIVPPLSKRTGQYVKRSVGSPGPTM